MEREQIIKALECCNSVSCDGCPYDEECTSYCVPSLLKESLSLVKELTEEDNLARKIFNEIESWFAIDGNLRIIANQKFYELRDKYTGESKK